jgi:hypothetical protein
MCRYHVQLATFQQENVDIPDVFKLFQRGPDSFVSFRLE